jgi:hypothetical protein
VTTVQKLDLLPAGTVITVGFELFPALKGNMARRLSDERLMLALFATFQKKVDNKLLELNLCPAGELGVIAGRKP